MAEDFEDWQDAYYDGADLHAPEEELALVDSDGEFLDMEYVTLYDDDEAITALIDGDSLWLGIDWSDEEDDDEYGI